MTSRPLTRSKSSLRRFILPLSAVVLAAVLFRPASTILRRDHFAASTVQVTQSVSVAGKDSREAGQHAPVASIYFNASIWTGEPEGYVEALAVTQDGRIIVTGPSEVVLAERVTDSVIIDLQGAHVIPGLIDPHVHLLKGGASLAGMDLFTVKTELEFRAEMKDACDRAEPGRWVLGVGWDETVWGGQLPHLTWADEACPYNPLYICRMDGHLALVNSRAAKLAGIAADTCDPKGGKIFRDRDGHFTGLLAENAMDLVGRQLPIDTHADKLRLAIAASEYLLSRGVTFTHDMGDMPTSEAIAFDNLEHVYMQLADSGQLPIRLFAFTPLSAWERLAEFVGTNGRAHRGNRLFWGGLKEFSDGSLGSGTALMHEPYTNEPSTSGIRTIDYGQLEDMVGKADAAGLQVAVHAIGDQAVDEVLTLFDRVASAGNDSDTGPKPRHRIEHAQHLSGSATAERFGRSSVTVVANPLHLLPDKRVLEQRLGKERSGVGRSYALNSLLKAGTSLAFASDWPVVQPEALLGMYAAAFRRAPGEAEPFWNEEAVTLEEALRASTIGGARLVGLEEHVGSLRKGKWADFTVLSSDPLAMTPDSPLPKVLQTFVDGLCAYNCHNQLT